LPGEKLRAGRRRSAASAQRGRAELARSERCRRCGNRPPTGGSRHRSSPLPLPARTAAVSAIPSRAARWRMGHRWSQPSP